MIYVEEALPELDPVIYHEVTSYGWRGLTAHGEVLEVKTVNGYQVPDEIVVARDGNPIGRRIVVRNDIVVNIDKYLEHFNAAVAHYRHGRTEAALIESEAAMSVSPTLRAKFNRAMVLLALGRWDEGLEEYWQCEQEPPFMRPQVRATLDRGFQPWRGEDLRGKRLLVIHAHGYGDTIMMLRYLPKLQEMGVDVVLEMPPLLQPLTQRWGGTHGECDYFCPILHLLKFLQVTPENVDGNPYLTIPRRRYNVSDRKRIGIAWSIGKPSDGDYPRQVPLRDLVTALDGADLHSVQIQGADEASGLGVRTYEFQDFADCAALMMQMDAIVSVDTAALHLAGAIGHPCVYGLLSSWASWRWLAPWYANVKLCRQATADDWMSALAQIQLD